MDAAAILAFVDTSVDSPDFLASDSESESGERDLAGILALAVQPPGEAARRRRFRAKRAAKKRAGNARARRTRCQILAHNKSGNARTLDHLIPEPQLPGSAATVPRVMGSATWKKWTPQTIQKCGYFDENASTRTMKEISSGGSALHASECRLIVASIAATLQSQGIDRIRRCSWAEPYRFFVTNAMFDLTKLPYYMTKFVDGVNGNGCQKAIRNQRNWQTLAMHVQWTYDDGGGIKDLDIWTPPMCLKNAKADTVFNAFRQRLFLGHKVGELPSTPKAKWSGTVISCDGCPTNGAILKRLPAFLPRPPGPPLRIPVDECGSFWMYMLCIQHRTGNIVALITDILTLLGQTFCTVHVFYEGDWVLKLKAKMRSVLDRHMVISNDDDIQERTIEEEQFAQELLRRCYVECCDDWNNPVVKERLQGLATLFLEFFAGPFWRVIQHRCPPGCCGVSACADRNTSVDRAMEILEITLLAWLKCPSKNKWTKMKPTIGRVAFKLAFVGLRWAMESQLEDMEEPEDRRHLSADYVTEPDIDSTAFRLIRGKRQSKVLDMFCSKDALPMFLLWITVCDHIMVPHTQ